MKFARLLQFAFIVVAALLVYSFVASAQDGELRRSCASLCAVSPNYVGDDRLAPDIRLKDLNGTTTQLSSLRGKTVVLVFWTTTCAGCKQQMPSVAELAEIARGNARLAVLTVAVDDSPDAVRRQVLATTHRSDPFPVLLDPESEYVLNRYGTRMFPETWVIDPQGVIRARFDGPRDWSSPVMLELLEDIGRGDRCPVEVQGGVVSGRGASLCRSISAEGN